MWQEAGIHFYEIKLICVLQVDFLSMVFSSSPIFSRLDNLGNNVNALFGCVVCFFFSLLPSVNIFISCPVLELKFDYGCYKLRKVLGRVCSENSKLEELTKAEKGMTEAGERGWLESMR